MRLALGASPGQLKRDVVKRHLPIVLAGVGLGVLAGAVAARAAGALLFGVSPLDPVSVTGAVAVMGSAALLATYLPTRRVATIDPTQAIRVE